MYREARPRPAATATFGAALLLLVGCKGKTTDDSGDSAEEVSPWSVPSEAVGDAMLLSAWSEGDAMLVVGGDLGEETAHGDLLRYEAGTICVEEAVTDQPLWWIHGTGEGEWYAVGAGGTVLHESGGERVREDLDTEATLFGVWDDGEGTVWAVGGHVDDNTGEIWRRTDGTWEAVQTGLDGMVFKVWDGWFVGVDLSFRLVEGELEPITTDMRMVTARGRDGDDVWVVGGATGSEVARWDGSGWEAWDTTYLGTPLNGVWTDDGEEVWITGNSGTMAWWGGERWEIPDLPLTSDHFHAVWKHQGEVWFVGGNFFSAGDNHGTMGRY
ncbi:MAG: hypothetical protein QGG40_02860, partial [Myxococcota bacterium]|nr:hypothetical protein [Myxococcota bacterium]